ncbi:MAG TPA: hypothetical protein DEB42_00390 [Jeotgalicoccus sp.]|nr:hypothetical protein [Jeotgalicoccus sp.]
MTTFKLEQYINFESLEELNHHVSQHVKNNQLNDTQFNLFTLLARYSVKYLGASYLKLDTIASLLDVSKSTVQRGLRELVKLNIITKVHNYRKSGGFGATIFVINKFDSIQNEDDMTTRLTTHEKPQSTGLARVKEWLQKEETSSKSLNLKYLVTPKSTQIDREHNINYMDIVPSHIPTKLGEFAIKFFNSADVTRLYYSMNKALEPYNGRVDYDSERLADFMHKGIRALITALKNHNYNPKKYSRVRNIFSYAAMATLRIAVKDEFADLDLYR